MFDATTAGVVWRIDAISPLLKPTSLSRTDFSAWVVLVIASSITEAAIRSCRAAPLGSAWISSSSSASAIYAIAAIPGAMAGRTSGHAEARLGAR
jgi:hypothetical protein